MFFDPVINHVPELNILQGERFKRLFAEAIFAKSPFLFFLLFPKSKN
jgi:hypothetical protein